MATSSNIESDVQLWLQTALKKDNVSDLSVNIVGGSEKGDGYMGDIIFVTAVGKVQDGFIKEYNFVLKCSKRSEVLRKTSPVKESFLNEIFVYENVLPTFTQFQIDKGIATPFDSVPKYYGSFTGDNVEVIVFENLKKSGYELWPKKQPLTRKHIDMVVKQYGKFHATSVAFKAQQPRQFQRMVDGLGHSFRRVIETSNLVTLFESSIDEAYELVKDDLDSKTMFRWRSFKGKINFVFKDMPSEVTGLKVIIHGDCWNNNFMYLSENCIQEIPIKVAMLDWQIARYSSPILDLSNFLFACISKEDLDNLDDILATYYSSFTNYLRKLGISDTNTIYSAKEFLSDWKNYCKHGILIASLIMKICSTQKDEILDVTEAAENGKDVFNIFLNEIRDKDNYKSRIRPIIEYVVKHDLI